MNREPLGPTLRQGQYRHEIYYQSLYCLIWNVSLSLNGGGALQLEGMVEGSTSGPRREDSFGNTACLAWDKEGKALAMEGKIVLEIVLQNIQIRVKLNLDSAYLTSTK